MDPPGERAAAIRFTSRANEIVCSFCPRVTLTDADERGFTLFLNIITSGCRRLSAAVSG
jgi:hypothetical protein